MDNFNKLNWIPFYDEVKINKCTLVYKSLHDQAPQYIKNLFKTNNEINFRQTRHGEYNWVCPKYNYATEGGKSVTVSSIKIWNNLPKDIKTKSSVNSFKFAPVVAPGGGKGGQMPPPPNYFLPPPIIFCPSPPILPPLKKMY
jgi:hypothetical protein